MINGDEETMFYYICDLNRIPAAADTPRRRRILSRLNSRDILNKACVGRNFVIATTSSEAPFEWFRRVENEEETFTTLANEMTLQHDLARRRRSTGWTRMTSTYVLDIVYQPTARARFDPDNRLVQLGVFPSESFNPFDVADRLFGRLEEIKG